jgi:hypothetical protein
MERVMTTDELISAMDATANAALPPDVIRLLGPSRVPPPSQDELEAFETEISATLPDDYRQFLLRSNGGSLDGRYCFEKEAACVIVRFVGGLQGAHSLRAARGCYQGHEVRIPLTLLWIMEDPGGNAVCLGLTGKYRGQVYFWVHDEGPDPDEWDGEVETAGNIRLLADSFTEFVAGLHPRDDD